MKTTPSNIGYKLAISIDVVIVQKCIPQRTNNQGIKNRYERHCWVQPKQLANLQLWNAD